MAVKTSLSHHDFSEILANYRVGDLLSGEPLKEGTVQTIYRLNTATSSFIFKYYENRPLESVRFEANVVAYVTEQDFPTAKVIKSTAGEAVGIYNDKPYILFEFIEGQPVNEFSLEQQRGITHLAASLQNITVNYRPPWHEFRWNYRPELCLQLAHERAQQLDTSTAHAKVEWFAETLSKLRFPEELPRGVCHCDYHPSNMLFKNGQMQALIDFDDANYTYLLFDLVNLIDGWAWPHDGQFNSVKAQEIVANYQQVRPLSNLEKDHLFDVHKLGILFDGIWFFARGEIADFYERRKIEYLDAFGRENYRHILFGK